MSELAASVDALNLVNYSLAGYNCIIGLSAFLVN